jgi:phage tail-like protein
MKDEEKPSTFIPHPSSFRNSTMPTNIPSYRVSSYLDYLPALFQPETGAPNFVGRFLLAFEKILSGGLGDAEQPGIEEVIDRLYTYFDPGPAGSATSSERAPAEFLTWLAQWVALMLREDWEEEEKRRFISRIVPLYRLRGTKAGLKEMLRTYTGGLKVEIYEFDEPAHYFQVEMFLGVRDPTMLRRQEQIARAIIDQEKPAHTYYALKTAIPTLQIGQHSTVGVDTLLGEPNE